MRVVAANRVRVATRFDPRRDAVARQRTREHDEPAGEDVEHPSPGFAVRYMDNRGAQEVSEKPAAEEYGAGAIRPAAYQRAEPDRAERDSIHRQRLPAVPSGCAFGGLVRCSSRRRRLGTCLECRHRERRRERKGRVETK